MLQLGSSQRERLSTQPSAQLPPPQMASQCRYLISIPTSVIQVLRPHQEASPLATLALSPSLGLQLEPRRLRQLLQVVLVIVLEALLFPPPPSPEAPSPQPLELQFLPQMALPFRSLTLPPTLTSPLLGARALGLWASIALASLPSPVLKLERLRPQLLRPLALAIAMAALQVVQLLSTETLLSFPLELPLRRLMASLLRYLFSIPTSIFPEPLQSAAL